MIKIIKHNDLQVKIDTLGAYIIEFNKAGEQIFYPKKEIKVGNSSKLRGGNHVCLPHFGVSEKINQSNHGFARSLEWDILEESDHKLILTLQAPVKDYEEMEVSLEYSLEDNTFTSKLEVENLGEEPFTISPAFHPYFAYKDVNSLKVNGEKLEITDQVRESLFKGQVKEIEIDGKKIILENKNINKYVIWTDELDKYICIEPTYNYDALNRDLDLIQVDRGKIKEFEFIIRL
ncbi:aldose epimerase family protein [Helcococcus massiliensis]|uniref:aldose epimerase family protein n=1 Tax=Helcococcus massiliensis TaxID=2040290 RepID=UPI000CDEC0AE|nr:hypothetical protein [Helcococcus massiliensis]